MGEPAHFLKWFSSILMGCFSFLSIFYFFFTLAKMCGCTLFYNFGCSLPIYFMQMFKVDLGGDRLSLKGHRNSPYLDTVILQRTQPVTKWRHFSEDSPIPEPLRKRKLSLIGNLHLTAASAHTFLYLQHIKKKGLTLFSLQFLTPGRYS